MKTALPSSTFRSTRGVSLLEILIVVTLVAILAAIAIPRVAGTSDPYEAVDQARQFRTKWESELVRYLIHGVLHLCGYDDQRPADRRRMKREEDRLLKQIGRLFPIKKLRIRSATATRSNQGRP